MLASMRHRQVFFMLFIRPSGKAESKALYLLF